MVSYRQIKERFGEPKQIAFIYVNEMDTDEILGNLRIRDRIARAVLISLVVLVLSYISAVIVETVSFKKDMNGYAIVEIYEVKRTEIEDGRKIK